ncbi:MAG TPA: hypothetical protein VEX68_15870 [Bryobacteraceae bacterium]|nr:hypothetical protein [Bryobacteraceae bacterium]
MSTTKCAPELQAPREEILEHLQSILEDRRFASAERNTKFLKYVVTCALDGRADEIKETVIGSEVYGRSSDYDPRSDSIVRVEASRLRQKLRSYYEAEGRFSRIRIHLPSGSYIPQFEYLADTKAVTSLEPLRLSCDEPETSTPYPSNRLTVKPMMLASGFAVIVVLISMSVARGSRATNESQNSEALAAWQEGIALLHQDPHSGHTDRGAPKTLLRAIDQLEFAVTRSPRFAPAWATLSEAYDYATAYVGRDLSEDARRAEAAARQAIVLDDKLSAGHHMLALNLGSVKWDFVQSELEYKRALVLDPRNVYAVVEYADLLRKTGRSAQAAQLVREARALLPALPPLAAKEAEIQLDLGRPDAALATAKTAIELNRDYLRAYVTSGIAHEFKEDFSQALRQYEHVLAVNPFERRALPAYGYLLAKTGQTAKAREVLARLENMSETIRNVSYQIAVVHMGLGDETAALDALERAWRTRQAHFPFAAAEYRFRSLHNNQRFRELLRRVGLKPVV